MNPRLFPMLVLAACSDYNYSTWGNDEEESSSMQRPNPGQGDGSGDPSGGDGGNPDGDGGDGGSGDPNDPSGGDPGSDDECFDDYEDLSGEWSFHSDLQVNDAIAGWVDWLGDAAGDVCVWLDATGAFSDAPDWAPDLICLVAEVTNLMEDMDVHSNVTLTSAGDGIFTARETWETIILDPGDEHLVLTMSNMDCPIDQSTFSVSYDCDGNLVLSRHEVDLALDGVLALALDVAACQTNHNAPGCGWDQAMYQICTSITDPTLRALCGTLRVPDPCVETTQMELAGSATVLSPNRFVGDWDGEIFGDGFGGTLEATRQN